MTTGPRSHAAILRDVGRANDRIRKANAVLDAALGARRALYLEARHRNDPVPFRRIAEAAGTTEAAVMQVVKKAEADA